ncbi:protein FAM3A-like [Megalops cyprinoides]|uniref:protein FAM3A-like n=1 Tax=Megalops cyprinoides TaxID=118141 RepID=UPI0018650332|nr:protein FAM3A-like [Megalops cyprinoides]
MQSHFLGLPKSEVVVSDTAKVRTFKCGLPRECPVDHFAFHIKSGAANVVGPKICFEDHVIMSSVLNNIGPGLNIALINGVTGKTEKNGYFNMYSGKVEDLLQFLKDIKPGTIVLVASYDDPATKLTDEAQNVFTNLGSTMIKSLKFRDTWVFAGASGITDKSPFERHMKNEREKNIYDGWPEMLELGGCFPKTL